MRERVHGVSPCLQVNVLKRSDWRYESVEFCVYMEKSHTRELTLACF